MSCTGRIDGRYVTSEGKIDLRPEIFEEEF
jgi:hypothetical protein